MLKMKSKCKTDLVGHICDNVYWYVLYLLPVILFVVYWILGNTGSISDVMSLAKLDIVSDNYIYTGLVNMFGSTGIMPIFADNSLLMYGSYFITIFFVHLVADILLWPFRAMHRVVGHGFGGASHE